MKRISRKFLALLAGLAIGFTSFSSISCSSGGSDDNIVPVPQPGPGDGKQDVDSRKDAASILSAAVAGSTVDFSTVTLEKGKKYTVSKSITLKNADLNTATLIVDAENVTLQGIKNGSVALAKNATNTTVKDCSNLANLSILNESANASGARAVTDGSSKIVLKNVSVKQVVSKRSNLSVVVKGASKISAIVAKDTSINIKIASKEVKIEKKTSEIKIEIASKEDLDEGEELEITEEELEELEKETATLSDAEIEELEKEAEDILDDEEDPSEEENSEGTSVTSDTTFLYTDPTFGELTVLAKTDGTFTAGIQNFTIFAGTYSIKGKTVTITLKEHINEAGTGLTAVKEEETMTFIVGENNVLTPSTNGSGETGGEHEEEENPEGTSVTSDTTFLYTDPTFGELTVLAKTDGTFTAGIQNFTIFAGTYSIKGKTVTITVKQELNAEGTELVAVEKEDTMTFIVGENNVLTPSTNGSGETGSGETGGESGSGESGAGETGGESGEESDNLVYYTVYHSFENLEGEYDVDESLTETLEGKLGAKTAAVAKEETGFDAQDIEQVEIGRNTSVTIKYTLKTFDYTVCHSFENLDGKYVVDEKLTETLQGKYGAKTSAVAKKVTGFSAPTSIKQETIGTETVVTIKYERNDVFISFDSDGGSSVKAISGKYGESVKAPKEPTKKDYTFKGWSPALPETFDSDLKVKALWEREKGDVSVTIY